MKRTIALATALVVSVAACGDDGPTGPGGSNNSMEATVAGDPFDPPSTQIEGSYNPTAGTFAMSGNHTVGGVTTTVLISLTNVTGADEYDLNPNFAGQFGSVTITEGAAPSVWTTILAPGNGSIEFTTLNSERAVGIFNFTGQAAGAPATGQVMVTSGQFDIEF